MSSSNDWESPDRPGSAGSESQSSDGTAPEHEISPYEPPDASVGDDSGGPTADQMPQGPAPEVYSPMGVGIGTFLGGPLAATILLYLNFSTLGWDSRAQNTAILGGLATIGIFSLAYVIPSDAGTGVSLIWTVGAFFIAKHYQQEIESQFGPVRHTSNWNAAGIGCLSILASVAVIFVIVFMFYGL